MFNIAKQKVVNQDYSLSKFNKVDIDIPTGDVVLKVGNKYHVSYSGAEKIAPEIKVKDSKLKIGFKNQVTHIRLFNFKQLNSKIVIEMPKEQLEGLNVDNANGNFSADYLGVKTGNIDLSNGNIDIKDLKTKDGISFDTSKGNIRVKSSNASGYDLDTSLGKVTISGKKQGNSFEKNSDSRNVLEADTSLGNVSVN
ncbi:DUF4097 family beta strand repeat-containing protein [Lactobacillus taiwanensis]|uniref:DUF4097 family beta strand repeat-containing protein n=1 Tax=Lactobacillus taiwanensis TaxID=508451 RepID=UPI00242F3062|nr:DUF4097 family beta strand repeat-containing protein [Lactobacillus taiwanensis]